MVYCFFMLVSCWSPVPTHALCYACYSEVTECIHKIDGWCIFMLVQRYTYFQSVVFSVWCCCCNWFGFVLASVISPAAVWSYFCSPRSALQLLPYSFPQLQKKHNHSQNSPTHPVLSHQHFNNCQHHQLLVLVLGYFSTTYHWRGGVRALGLSRDVSECLDVSLCLILTQYWCLVSYLLRVFLLRTQRDQ